MLKNLVKDLKLSSTLLINETSRKLEEQGKKYNYLDIDNINSAVLDSKKEARFKITRPSPYGER